MGSYDCDDFESQVLQRSHRIPVLVDFWAAWCGPCRSLGPVLERLAQQSEGRWALAKVDTQSHPQLGQRYGIRSIPAVKLFIDGEVADEFVGALPEPRVRQFLERALPAAWAAELATARGYLEQGNRSAGLEALEKLAGRYPAAVDVRLLWAREVLFDEPAHAIELLEPVGMGLDGADAAQALRVLARLLSQEPEQLPQGGSQPAFAAAIERLRAGDLDAALQGLIAVLERDRGYGDDLARRAVLAIFSYLGDQHPLTRAHRVAFSSAVYA